MANDYPQLVQTQNGPQFSSIVNSPNDIVTDGEVAHYISILTQRIDTSLSAPLDPYHASVAPFYTPTRIYEKWVDKDGFHEVVKLENSETILAEYILTHDSFSVYDAAQGIQLLQLTGVTLA